MGFIRFVLLPKLVTFFLFSTLLGMNDSGPIGESIDISKIISVIKETEISTGLAGNEYYIAKLPNNVELVAQFYCGHKFCAKRITTGSGIILPVSIHAQYFDGIKLFYDLACEEK